MCVFAAGGMNSRSGSTLWRRAPPSSCWLLPLERICSGELKTLPHASSAIPRGSVHGEKLETQRRWCDTMQLNCDMQVFFAKRRSHAGRATLRALARSSCPAGRSFIATSAARGDDSGSNGSDSHCAAGLNHDSDRPDAAVRTVRAHFDLQRLADVGVGLKDEIGRAHV